MQQLFARLSVFAGGCTFQALEAVCNSSEDLDLLDGLTALVDKSLVRTGGEHEPRFRLLETIREYAAEKLAEGEEREALLRRHAGHFLAFAHDLAPALTGPRHPGCLM